MKVKVTYTVHLFGCVYSSCTSLAEARRDLEMAERTGPAGIWASVDGPEYTASTTVLPGDSAKLIAEKLSAVL
jgi:hypothetical protein